MNRIESVDIENVLTQMRRIREQMKPPTALPVAAPQADFAALLKHSIDQVNVNQQVASQRAQAFEIGDPDSSLVDVMVSMQKANVSFQAAVQVRNKLVDAYKEVMNMPM